MSMEAATAPNRAEVITRVKILHWISGFALHMPNPEEWPETQAALKAATSEALLQELRRNRDQLCEQMRERGYWSAMTEAEKEFAQTLPCDLNKQQIIDGIWSLEALGVLLWSMRKVTVLPPFDTAFDASILGLVDRSMEGAELRPLNELQHMREIAKFWHWRSRTRQLQESGQNPAPEMGFPDLDSIVRWTVKQSEAQKMLPNIIEEDFPAKGKAYRDLTQNEWIEVRSIAMERHLALNWLCGYGRNNRWDETSTET